jgi:hypothetical protein
MPIPAVLRGWFIGARGDGTAFISPGMPGRAIRRRWESPERPCGSSSCYTRSCPTERTPASLSVLAHAPLARGSHSTFPAPDASTSNRLPAPATGRAKHRAISRAASTPKIPAQPGTWCRCLLGGHPFLTRSTRASSQRTARCCLLCSVWQTS